jgi:hypothetical protein
MTEAGTEWSTGLHLPCTVRVDYRRLTFTRFEVPIDEGHTNNFYVLAVRRLNLLNELFWRAYIGIYYRWKMVDNFSSQDAVMAEIVDYTTPERLSPTDKFPNEWRRFVVECARTPKDRLSGRARNQLAWVGRRPDGQREQKGRRADSQQNVKKFTHRVTCLNRSARGRQRRLPIGERMSGGAAPPGALALEASRCGLSRAHSPVVGVVIEACRRAIVQPVQVPHRAVLDSTRSRAGVVGWRCYVGIPALSRARLREGACGDAQAGNHGRIAPASSVADLFI